VGPRASLDNAKIVGPMRFCGKDNFWKDEPVLFTFILGTVEYTPISSILTITFDQSNANQKLFA
jgi:hypothetical protein